MGFSASAFAIVAIFFETLQMADATTTVAIIYMAVFLVCHLFMSGYSYLFLEITPDHAMDKFVMFLTVIFFAMSIGLSIALIVLVIVE